MTKTMDRVKKDEERQAKSLEELEQGAADIAERKQEAAGKSPSLPKRSRTDSPEAQRKQSQAAGKSLSKADLDTYRDL